MNAKLLYMLFLLPLVAVAQAAGESVLFESPLESGSGWTVVHEADPADNRVTFGFDYSEFGIPEAPNSRDSDAPTSGLQLISNLDLAVTNSATAFPTGADFRGRFRFQFDLWMNVIGPLPAGAAGSTEFAGGGVGRDNSDTHPLSGATLLITGEGGSSNDIRVYADDEVQFYATHVDPATNINDLYAPELASGNANFGNDYFAQIFPGKAAPVEQLSLPGADQSGVIVDGGLGFRWVTYTWTVDTLAGTAQVQVTDAETGQTANIATVGLNNTYVDRDSIDENIITSLEGNIGLTYCDLFSSIAPTAEQAEYTFGVFDNVLVVRIPEPASVALLALGSLAFGRRRR